MADVKWIKIVTDIFGDEKILLIESMPEADSIIVIWFKLLVLAGKTNNKGVFLISDRIPYTDEMLATIFRRKITIIRLALQTFENFGMIEIINNVITIPNWGKHQTLDQIEAKRNYMKKYMQQYRKKQATLIDCKTNSKTNGKVNVSEAEGEGDKEDKEELDKDNDDNKAPNFFKIIEEEMLIPITATVADQVRAWVEDYPPELIEEALKITILNGIRNLTYPDRILLDWGARGIKTVAEIATKGRQAQQGRKKAPRQETVPEWMEQHQKERPETAEEEIDLEEVAELLRSFKEGYKSKGKRRRKNEI